MRERSAQARFVGEHPVHVFFAEQARQGSLERDLARERTRPGAPPEPHLRHAAARYRTEQLIRADPVARLELLDTQHVRHDLSSGSFGRDRGHPRQKEVTPPLKHKACSRRPDT